MWPKEIRQLIGVISIALESRKRKEINDMMEEMSTLREENRNMSKIVVEFKANVEALEERAKLYERR